MGKEHSCSDCRATFQSSRERTRHAFRTGHMSDRSCIPCSKVFFTPHGLSKHTASHRNHREAHAPDETVSKLGTSELRASTHTTPADTIVTTLSEPTMTGSLPHHLLPSWWREKGNPGAALQKRPNHGFPWASPAFTEAIYLPLKSELLNSERRKADGFPASLAIYRYMQMDSAEMSRIKNVLPLPRAGNRPEVKPYAALVIDCEMVELENQVQDLVSLSVIDFVTGKVVLDTLVQPVSRVKCWRSRITGVNSAILREAKARNGVLRGGWTEARAKIFEIADSDTIFVGHALPNDLKILRIAADNVVDTTVLLAQAAFGPAERFPRRWSLKIACKELINVSVQVSSKPHSPLEDALATRELVLWCLTHPTDLLDWGTKARIVYEKERAEREKKREEERRKAAEERKQKMFEENAAWAEATEMMTKELEQAASAEVEA